MLRSERLRCTCRNLKQCKVSPKLALLVLCRKLQGKYKVVLNQMDGCQRWNASQPISVLTSCLEDDRFNDKTTGLPTASAEKHERGGRDNAQKEELLEKGEGCDWAEKGAARGQ